MQRVRSNVAKSVYLSKCTDIFTNLALEDWLYKNLDFANRHVLMLWRNRPCVVIGRHQNPWLECNFAALPLIGGGAELARRNSGGGTVYHDLGNLNLTFFTGRNEYSRKNNLELVSRALKKSFNINSEISPREDLCIGDLKISGTASKLGRTNAYHHCTLLVRANKDDLRLALKNTLGNDVKTNASKSVKSKITNLSEQLASVSVEEVMEAIIAEYGGGATESIDDDSFPRVGETRKTFRSFEWRFGKTPKFEIVRSVCDNDSITSFLLVEQGKVANCGFKCHHATFCIVNKNLHDLEDLFGGLVGKVFGKDVLDDFDSVVTALRHSETCRTFVSMNS